MIQRIQSLYLLLSGLGILALFILPFASAHKHESNFFMDGLFDLNDSNLLLILTCLAGTIAIVGIFLFKNRPLQSKIIWLLIGIIVILAASTFYEFYTHIGFSYETEISMKAGVGLPFLAILFALLAQKGIKKDVNLVKSMDRLR